MAKGDKPGKDEGITFSPEINIHLPPELFERGGSMSGRMRGGPNFSESPFPAALLRRLREVGFEPTNSREQPFRDPRLFRDDNKPNPDHETRRSLHPGKGAEMGEPYGEASNNPLEQVKGAFSKLNTMMEDRRNASKRHEEREIQLMRHEMDIDRDKLKLKADSFKDYLSCRLRYDLIYFGAAGLLAAWFGYNTDLNNVFYTISGAGMLRGALFAITGR